MLVRVLLVVKRSQHVLHLVSFVIILIKVQQNVFSGFLLPQSPIPTVLEDGKSLC